MYNAAVKSFPNTDAAILCAAVADYRPTVQAQEKLKRKSETMILELTANKDIAAELGKIKNKNQRLIGFALETHDETANALKKIENKNLDFIILNSLNDKGAGFKYDTNKISILAQSGHRIDFPLKSKKEVAADIINSTLLI